MVSATPIIPAMITSLQIFSIPAVNSFWTYAFVETKIWHQREIQREVNDQDSASFPCLWVQSHAKMKRQPSTGDGGSSALSRSHKHWIIDAGSLRRLGKRRRGIGEKTDWSSQQSWRMDSIYHLHVSAWSVKTHKERFAFSLQSFAKAIQEWQEWLCFNKVPPAQAFFSNLPRHWSGCFTCHGC